MKPELDESLSRFHAAIVGGAKGEEATRAIPPLSGTTNAPVEYLDLATVIKVSQAVSGEIVQEKQLEILMRTAIEQAGAERGVLVLPPWTEPRIAAQATTGDGGIVVKLHDEAMTPAVLPESVIQYVVRTSKSVILDDAAAQNPFSADPYIRQQHARSILCLPFLNQGQLIGVLYLENNLTPGVFAPARIAVLKLLASQAAISLENARLHRDLAEREAKIRRLVEAQTPRAEDELRAIIDNAPVFLWSDLPDGYCDFLNQPWLTYFNLSLQEAQGAGWAAALHPDDAAHHLESWQKSVSTGIPLETEARFRRSDGEYRWFLTRANPLRDKTGRIVKWYGTNIDIENLKRTEARLRQSEAYLAEAQRLSHTGSFGWKPDTGEIVWSAETYRIFEYDRAVTPTIDLVAQRVHPEDRADFQSAIERASGGAPDFEHAYRLLLPDGRVKHFHALAHATQDASGNREFVGAVTDITDQRQAEESLRKSEAYLSEAQRLSQTGSWAWSPVSNAILYWSEECYRILGYDPAQGLPSFESSFERIHPEDRPALAETIERAVREKAEFQIEYRLVLPDGTRRNVRILSHPVLDASGKVIEFVGTVMDVTEQKRASQERRAHLWFLESMDRINRAMQRSNDVELMTSGVMQEALEIFACDRACLIYPCDPDAPTYRTVMEHTSPEYGGALSLGQNLSVTPEWGEAVRRVLHHPEAVVDPSVSPGSRERYRVASMLAIAVRPKGDRPYLLAVHSARSRPWTAAEVRLFEETAQRLGDALTSVLAHRNLLAREEELRRSQHYLAEGQKLSHSGSWAWNPISNTILYWSAESYRIYGYDPAHGLPSAESVFERFHPEDLPAVLETVDKAVREKVGFQLEHRLILPGGIVRNLRCLADTVLNASGELIEYIGTVMDVTEQKRAEEERKEHLWFLECMDRVNREMQRTNDVEGMMSGVLEETLAIFGSDRAWLVYPCDPDAATSRVVMEHTRPEYPGAFGLGEEFPVDTQAAEQLRRVLEGPGASTDLSISPEIRERFSIQSIIAIAVRPKGDRPYLFGLHQCSHARAWTAAERRLFEEIARRLEDALTSVLAHRNLLASQEELRASEERFRTFVDHATDAFFLYDEECIVLDVNRQACEALGYTREELIGMHPTEFNEDMTQERALHIKQRLREHGSATFSARRRRKDGSLFPVEERIRGFKRGGRVFGIGLASDITDRRHREQRLLAQFRVTQTLSQASSLEQAAPRILGAMCEALEWDLGALWQVDPEGGVLRCIATWPSASAAPPNFAAATRAISFGPGMGLPGRVWSSGGPVCIRDVALDPELPRAKSAAKEGLHAAFAFPVMLKSGIVGVIELFSREVRDADRGLLQMMAAIGSQVAQFIERTRAEDALRDAREQLAQASKIASLAELSASIAHEINQPLQAIVANGHASLRWLDAAPPNIEKAISTAKRVVRDGNAAAEVVSRIRALFKYAAPAKVDLDINKLILQVGTLMADEIQGTAVSLEAELGEDLPRIRADAVQIQQVIVNLVRNAIEAMAGARRKPLLIRSRRSASHVVVDVRDQGRGLVDPEKIFEPFVSTKGTGMGMGLTICRSIIEAHGGDIRVMHNEGPGVTFSFSLPLEASDAT